MPRKMTAASLAAVWLAFLTLEFIGVFGLLRPLRTDITTSVPSNFIALARVELTDAKVDGGPDHALAWSGDFISVPVPSCSSPNIAEVFYRPAQLYDLHQSLRL